MTDTLNVNASTPNSNAITGIGDGSGFGIRGVGGSIGGGGRFEGTGNGSMGVSAVGGPAGGSGLVASGTGDNGLGAELYVGTAPTATVPRMGVYLQGLVRFDGVPPNANVDPGFDNAVGKQNIVTSSAILVADGAGGFTVLNNAGFNVDSWTGTVGGIATVTFARVLPGNGYRRHIDALDPYTARPNNVQNVNNFQFVVKDAAGTVVDLTTNPATIEVSTVGY
jgi:hypothetical protein